MTFVCPTCDVKVLGKSAVSLGTRGFRRPLLRSSARTMGTPRTPVAPVRVTAPCPMALRGTPPTSRTALTRRLTSSSVVLRVENNFPTRSILEEEYPNQLYQKFRSGKNEKPLNRLVGSDTSPRQGPCIPHYCQATDTVTVCRPNGSRFGTGYQRNV